MSSSNRERPEDHVTTLLHTLRGEAFRRQLNLQGSRIRAPTSLSSGPSLPPVLFGDHTGDDAPSRDVSSSHQSRTLSKTAGPPPPRSWIPPSSSRSSGSTSPEWRRNALSLVFEYTRSSSKAIDQSSKVPTLFQTCLHRLLIDFGGIPVDLFSFLPRHILREYVRYSAVFAPLPKEDLEAIWALENAGSVDGEVIITGPYASSVLSRQVPSVSDVPSEWDANDNSSDPDPPPIMDTFIVLSAPFPPSLMSLLPVTLTHLALVNIQRLPIQTILIHVPLLKFLDLSYNLWVGEIVENKLLRMEWRRLRNLEVVCFRECGIAEEHTKALQEVLNKGRLTDMKLILMD
ncbi:hypothetical protein M422DRAFT_272175 [Sphaerobolus stellatus SS14]|uniref:Uncharacterized protein n=1 Tax=Sphaerobolus stellatus (strain SS14) TaxID=990650 RepID=A0A0C9UMJ9_SPHS4|nr:hypothetical protein M422DRAFT_272175 [Sphaerobolus stellatus SS14]